MKEKNYNLIARSKWIDDLTEEEQLVLKKAHMLDKKIKEDKLKPYKVNILEGISEE